MFAIEVSMVITLLYDGGCRTLDCFSGRRRFDISAFQAPAGVRHLDPPSTDIAKYQKVNNSVSISLPLRSDIDCGAGGGSGAEPKR